MAIDGFEINPQEISVPNIMAVTARLAQVLAQEADFLAGMNIQEIPALQKEKVWLTKAMELQLKKVKKNPELLDDISDDERDEMEELFTIFDEVKQENYRRLNAAKEVNQRVVEAIAEVVNEQSKKGTYDEEGNPDYQDIALSVTLNEKV